MRRGKSSSSELPLTSNGLPRPRRKQQPASRFLAAFALLAIMMGTWWAAVGFLHLIQAETPPGAFDVLEDTPVVHGTVDAVINHALEAAGTTHHEPPPHRPLTNIHHQYRDHIEDGLLERKHIDAVDEDPSQQQQQQHDVAVTHTQGEAQHSSVQDTPAVHDTLDTHTDTTHTDTTHTDTTHTDTTRTDTTQQPQHSPVVTQHSVVPQHPPPRGIYTLAVPDGTGGMMALTKYAGTVSLVVNVASQCGYTDSNYRGLVALHEQYKHQGFQVIAFPCNQFGSQEPGAHDEIVHFAAQQYAATFPIMGKVDVNGANAAAVYTMLKTQMASRGQQHDAGDIQWNFVKFLVNRDGEAVHRYDMTFDSAQLQADIEALLAEQPTNL